MTQRSESSSHATCALCDQVERQDRMVLCAHGWRCRACGCGECSAREIARRAARARALGPEEHAEIMARRGWMDD